MSTSVHQKQICDKFSAFYMLTYLMPEVSELLYLQKAQTNLYHHITCFVYSSVAFQTLHLTIFGFRIGILFNAKHSGIIIFFIF